MSEGLPNLHRVMNAETCALLAQILPVFLLAFAVKGSLMTRATSEDARRRPRRLVRHRWLKDPRVEWAGVVVLLIGFEFFLALAAAGVLGMPAVFGWVVFALALAYAALEFWAAGVSAES